MRQVMKMKKLLKSKKGLSPVVAAIILIAVTVAVSIAVAAWMGSLTIGFMETSELTITDVEFDTNPPGSIFVYVTNSGTSSFTVRNIRVNGEIMDLADWSSGSPDNTVAPGDPETFTITHPVDAGSKYAVSLYDIDGTLVGAYTATA
jgi:flagellin-like protein